MDRRCLAQIARQAMFAGFGNVLRAERCRKAN
jgi:hypothetical protein